MASPADWKKMKVPELKEELARRGLDTSGLKAALLQRLEESLKPEDNSQVPTDGNDTAPRSEEKVSSEKIPEVKSASLEDGNSAAQPAMEKVEEIGEKKLDKGAEKSEVEPGTEDDKRKKRAERFGTTLPDDIKKVMRAERFGLKPGEVVSPATTGAEDEAQAAKLKARAERFGIPATLAAGLNGLTKVDLDDAEREKRRLRAEKYGLPSNPVELNGAAKPSNGSHTGTAEDEAKKAARAARFGATVNGNIGTGVTSPEDIEKKRRRAEKFGVPLATEAEMEAKKKQRAERFQQVAA
eukprot:TRINITY_DN390_c0_g1_i1.p1 TRINITY_DN390_c0_g1~~TRINITY_DN390_c0_g1_i1.p1  ORF type:complete len:297 (-),score=104.24 TRINITY_DN390_c0_g1_i1:897-1787(-)